MSSSSAHYSASTILIVQGHTSQKYKFEVGGDEIGEESVRDERSDGDLVHLSVEVDVLGRNLFRRRHSIATPRRSGILFSILCVQEHMIKVS